jgi:CRP-like cAMP-binding protein
MPVDVLDQQTALATVVGRLIAWGLPPEDVEHILTNAISIRELAPRAQLFGQGGPVEYVYFVHTGRLFEERIAQDGQGQRRVTLRREVAPGEFLGHYDLLYHQIHNTRARALEPCSLIAIEATALNRLLYRFPFVRQRMTPADKIGRLRTIPYVGALDLTVLSYLADASQVQQFAAGQPIFTDDAPAGYIYLIDQGQVEVTWRNGTQRWLGNGMAFGFLEWVLPEPPGNEVTPYGHTARAITPVTAFCVPRQAVIEIADLHPEHWGHVLADQCQQAVRRLTVFSHYGDDECRRLLGYMSHIYIPIHHLLMQQGEVGDSLWALLPGGRAVLRAVEGGQALQPAPVFGPNFFGELALRVEHPMESTVEAEPGSQWLRLHRADFQQFTSSHGEHLVEALTLSPAAKRYLGEASLRQRYAWLQSGEKLIIFQRHHWVVLVHKTLISVLLVALVGGGYYFFWSRGWNARWLRIIFNVALVLVLLHLVYGIVDYLNDYLLLTNLRVVRQEKLVFFAERRQSAFLEQVRNVDAASTFFGHLLNYGTLRVQTAATEGSIIIDYLPETPFIRQRILEQQNLRQQHFQASSKMVIQNLLEDRFGLRLRLPPRVLSRAAPLSPPIPVGLRQKLRRWLLPVARVRLPTDDKIVWRKHWIILVARLFVPATIFVLMLLLVLGQQLLPPALGQLAAILDSIWFVIGVGTVAWMAWNTADWHNDTYEVDRKQLADVEKKPLFFSEKRRTALLGEIENIDVSIPSPLHVIFNFGHVYLQTAAEQGYFTFDAVPDPRGVSEELRRRIEAYRYQQEATRAQQRAQELPDWFEMYSRLGVDIPGSGPGPAAG